VPLLTPQQLREATARDYMRQSARLGRELSQAQADRLAVADLELVANADRAGDLRGVSKDAAPNPARAVQRDRLMSAAQEQTGTRLAKDAPARPVRSRVMDANPFSLGETWARAVARLERILQGAGAATTIGAGALNAEVPKLAAKWAEAYAFYLTRTKAPPPGVDHNPFRGLSDRDAARKLKAFVEDLCDQSTGSLGAWRTPK